MNINKWMQKNTSDLHGKVVAVTGATGDLGRALCFYLAQLDASILMLNRNLEKSAALKQEILSLYPDVDVSIVRLDAGETESVDEACRALQDVKIDHLILNAGVYNVPVKKADSGYNNIFQINFLSPYRLVKKLLPVLRKSNAKVIMVSSIAYKNAKLNAQDVDYSQNTRAIKIYGNSKRFLMFSLRELLKNETAVSFAAVHPGISPTQMTTHYNRAINWIVKGGMKAIFPEPRAAALNLLAGIFYQCGEDEWIGPKRCDIWGRPKIKKIKKCDVMERKQIFDIAEEIYKNV